MLYLASETGFAPKAANAAKLAAAVFFFSLALSLIVRHNLRAAADLVIAGKIAAGLLKYFVSAMWWCHLSMAVCVISFATAESSPAAAVIATVMTGGTALATSLAARACALDVSGVKQGKNDEL